MASHCLYLSPTRLAWRTDWLSADELSLPGIAGDIIPVEVGHILAMEECTVLTVAIFVI